MGSTVNTAAFRVPRAIEGAPADAPALAPALRRFLKHPRLVDYNRLIAIVVPINLGVLSHHLARGDSQIDDGSALSALATTTLLNFTAAVVIRQRQVLNLPFTLAGRGPTSSRGAGRTSPGSDPNRETPASHILRWPLRGHPPAMMFPKGDQELDMTAAEVRSHLLRLQAEHCLAVDAGVAQTAFARADIDVEIGLCRAP
jgi:hypothetical protein